MSEKPFLQVVRGDATPEEIAVIIAVIAARSAGDPEPPVRARSTWADRSRLVRRPAQLGWRASGLPG
ncbi:MAG: acyl-CoA carboxylase subunit epsilon [Streptosporangiaceae bacterium]